MSITKPKAWQQPGENIITGELAAQLGISKLTAKILVNRGVKSVSAGREFLAGDLANMPSPYLFSGMRTAVNRIKMAINNHDRILIYGDYDVDGITATALLYELLKRLGTDVIYHIPERLDDGYGLNGAIIKRYIEQGVKLIITVDCGIGNLEEVSLAGQMGIDVIITDHHEPPAELPAALAVLNPKLEQGKVFDLLAGVGVAFKLAQAVHLDYGLPPFQQVIGGEYLDLVALGTIADIVPLIGENRLLVKFGLKFLESTWRPGLKSLIEKNDLWGEEINAYHVGFVLAPKLNAAGRIGNPLIALELLITEDTGRGEQVADLLNEENRKRQHLEQEIYLETERLIKEQVDLDLVKSIVLASDKWHPGVIGIVASRLAEKYSRPTILISLGEQEGKGSGRSIPGFNLYQALAASNELLLKFGGHEQAAGLSIETNKLSLFSQNFNEYAQRILDEEGLSAVVKIDAAIFLEEVTPELVSELELLAPFGYGNPRPVFACSNAQVMNWRKVGKEQNHLKATFSQETFTQNGIGFNLANYDQLVAASMSVNLAFGVEKNSWQGEEQLQLILKDIKPYYLSEQKIVVADKFFLADARHIKYRQRYMQRFDGEKNIVYVYDYETKQGIEPWLRENKSESWDFAIGNCSMGNNDNGQYYDHLFFYHLPLHWDDLNILAGKSNKIHLCYCKIPEDRLLKQKFPNRELIGQFYLVLKDFLGNNIKWLLYRELFGYLYRKLNLGPEDSKLIINILVELQLLLLKTDETGQKYGLSLAGEKKGKLDLSASQTYNKVMGNKDSFLYWSGFWLFAAKTDIQTTMFAHKQEN